jgi:hypothetical protein
MQMETVHQAIFRINRVRLIHATNDVRETRSNKMRNIMKKELDQFNFFPRKELVKRSEKKKGH